MELQYLGVVGKFSFNLWSRSSSPLKILRLCSFHMHQNNRGAIRQIWCLFLSNPSIFHLRRRFPTVARDTYFRLKTAKRSVPILTQWIKMWLAKSSFFLHKLHLLSIVQPFCLQLRSSPILLSEKTHSLGSFKSLNFFGWEIHTSLSTQRITLKLPFLFSFHTEMLSPSFDTLTK